MSDEGRSLDEALAAGEGVEGLAKGVFDFAAGCFEWAGSATTVGVDVNGAGTLLLRGLWIGVVGGVLLVLLLRRLLFVCGWERVLLVFIL